MEESSSKLSLYRRYLGTGDAGGVAVTGIWGAAFNLQLPSLPRPVSSQTENIQPALMRKLSQRFSVEVLEEVHEHVERRRTMSKTSVDVGVGGSLVTVTGNFDFIETRNYHMIGMYFRTKHCIVVP